MNARTEAWQEFRVVLTGLIAAVNHATIDTDAGFLEEELAVLDATRAYAAACVAEALADHPDCGKYCVCCQRGIDMSSDDLLAASEREVAALKALADPLALLEALAKYGDIYIEWGEPKTRLGHSLILLQHDFDGNAGPFYYHRYFRSGDPIPERDPLTREEAAVLLAGKERPP